MELGAISRRGRPASWFYFCAWWLFFLLINPGDLGSVDTARRLQVSHSWWTAAPEVAAGDWPEFGIPACGGTVRAWYGAGQSLLMLPADVIASSVTASPQARGVLVALFVFPLLAVATLFVIEALLRELGLTSGQARVVTAVFAVSTSFLPYSQINQENSLLVFLLITAAYGALRYAVGGSLLSLVGVTALGGVGILTRLPAIADAVLIMATAVFLRMRRVEGDWRSRWLAGSKAAAVGAATLLACVGLERTYHYWRFCEWAGTYYSKFAQTISIRHPDLPPGFPFSTPFWTGLGGFLWSKDYSVFATDPVLAGTVVLAAFSWRRWRIEERALLAVAGVLLMVLILFYARYYDWWGGSSWGSRFTTAPAQLACLVSLSYAARSWNRSPRPARIAILTVVAAGALVNLLALTFWYELEVQQQLTGLSRVPVVALRAMNVLGLATGNLAQWGLLGPTISERLVRPNTLAWLAGPKLGVYASGIVVVWTVAIVSSTAVIVRGLRAAVRT